MFLFHVPGLSFEGVRDSLLLHICFFLFGVWHTTFFRSNLSLVLALFGFDVFFVRALPFFWCVSACVVFLLWVLVCFLSILLVILGLSFLDCSVLMLFLLLHVLAARFCVCVGVFLGCLFRGTITESRMGMANREGSIYFSGFLIIGVFG